MKLQLREDYDLQVNDHGRTRIVGPRGICIESLGVEQIKVLEQLADLGIEEEGISALPNDSKQLLRMLYERDLLIRLMPNDDCNAYWRAHLPEESMVAARDLSDVSVLVMGCGGIGSIAADHLARAGVGRFFWSIMAWSTHPI